MEMIGSRIRELLEDRGDTQAILARVLSIDESAVSKLLAGRRGLAAGELLALCEHYGIPSDQILFPEREQQPAGVVLRADAGADAQRVLKRVEESLANLRYVRALTEK